MCKGSCREATEGLFCLCKLLFNKPFVYSLKTPLRGVRKATLPKARRLYPRARLTPCLIRLRRALFGLGSTGDKKGIGTLLRSDSCFGAGGRGRTDTVSLPLDFESSTSANSITPAYDADYYNISKNKNQEVFEIFLLLFDFFVSTKTCPQKTFLFFIFSSCFLVILLLNFFQKGTAVGA